MGPLQVSRYRSENVRARALNYSLHDSPFKLLLPITRFHVKSFPQPMASLHTSHVNARPILTSNDPIILIILIFRKKQSPAYTVHVFYASLIFTRYLGSGHPGSIPT